MIIIIVFFFHLAIINSFLKYKPHNTQNYIHEIASVSQAENKQEAGN